MTSNQPRTGEGIAVLRAATAPGCWRVDGFSGRASGLSAGEVRERMAQMEAARERAYAAYDKISWSGKFCRRDIGGRVEARKARVAALMGNKLDSGKGAEPTVPLG